MPYYTNAEISRFRLSTDGMLIDENKSTNVLRRVYTLKNNAMSEITWINIPNREKILHKMITTELVRTFFNSKI